jgi:hypothetical protein
MGGVFLVAEFLCSLWSRDKNPFKAVVFVDGVRLSQIRFVATGALSRRLLPGVVALT